VGDINSGLPNSDPDSFEYFADHLYFAATGPAGRELYRTDGRDITLLDDINPGTQGSDPDGLVELGGNLYFTAVGPGGRELYKTDGNSVTLFRDMNPRGSAHATVVGKVNGRLVFMAAPDGQVWQTFTTNGQTVASLGVGADVVIFGSKQFATQLFFTALADDGWGTYETDGEVTTRLPDIGFSDFGEHPIEFAGEMVFSAVGPAGFELYQTKGSIVEIVENINPQDHPIDPPFGGPFGLTRVAGQLFFFAPGHNGWEPFKLTLAGDADENGAVQFPDFVALANHFNQLGSWRDGDYDSNGTVEFADFVILANNFGVTADDAPTAQVPEPIGGAPLQIALSWLAWGICRKRSLT
jgi:ELWxxDGT repeat protein